MSRVLITYLAGAVLVRLADEGARVALLLLALERTAGPAFGGALIAAFMLPHVVAAPIVGGLADRTRHPRLLHAFGPLLFGASLAMASVGAGRLPAPLVLAAALIGGCGTPLLSGGLSGVLRQIVPKAQRQRAYGLDVATYNLASVCGPALAALLAARIGAASSTMVIAICAASGALAIALLPLERQVAHEHGPSIWQGVSLFWTNRRLGAVTFSTGLGQLGLGAVPVIAVLLGTQFGMPSAVGWLLSAEGCGALCGSLLYARRPILTGRPQLLVTLALLASAAPAAAIAVVGPVGGIPLMWFIGFLTGPSSGAQFEVRERESPRELNTQVFALGAGFKISMAAIGAALGGQLAGVGPAPLLIAVGSLQLLGGALAFALLDGRHSAQARGIPPSGVRQVGRI